LADLEKTEWLVQIARSCSEGSELQTSKLSAALAFKLQLQVAGGCSKEADQLQGGSKTCALWIGKAALNPEIAPSTSSELKFKRFL
jgi:hypothetical protein